MASTDPNPDTNRNPRTARGTNSPPSPSARPSYYMNGKVFIATGILLVIIIIFIVAFHLYTRVFWRRRRPSISWRLNLPSPHTGGLDKAIVNSLPTFTYTVPFLHEGGNVVSKEEAGEGVIECAVCLIEFEENDECRLLPKCNHSFHTECIDKWFLSNTTCPLCRTSAEPEGSNDACHTESSTAFSLPHQELGDHVGRTNSSPSDCLLPHQDSGSHVPWQGINDHMQRSRAGSPLGAELEGAGLHVRRMLARTCSSGVDASYDLVSEGTHNDTMSVAMLGEKLSSMARDRARRNHAGEASVQHPHLPNWQRSVSDKSLNTREAMQFPSNVLFWGNHSHVDSRLHTDHWRVGGRSLPHISIDVRRPQESVLKPHSALSSPTQCLSTSERAYVSPSGQRQPSRMNPSKSEDSAFHLAEHGKA